VWTVMWGPCFTKQILTSVVNQKPIIYATGGWCISGTLKDAWFNT